MMQSTYYDTTQPYQKYDSDSSIASLRENLEESKDVLKDNIEKITHRDQLILNIDEKSELLSENSNIFKKRSIRLNRLSWVQAHMCEIILVFIILIIIIILIVVLNKK